MSSLKVSDVMCRDVSVCRPSDSLDAAARVMWERDCGIVPVVDAAGGLVGVVTDRDLCMAGYIGGATLAEIPIVRAMARELTTVGPDDELESAQALFAKRALHRLPVVDGERRVVGMLSLADLVRAAAAELKAPARRRAAEALLETLAAVKRSRSAPPSQAPGAAAQGDEVPRPSSRRATSTGTVTPTAKPAPLAKKATSAKRDAPSQAGAGRKKSPRR